MRKEKIHCSNMPPPPARKKTVSISKRKEKKEKKIGVHLFSLGECRVLGLLEMPPPSPPSRVEKVKPLRVPDQRFGPRGRL